MLHEMCQHTLSAADIKAIGRSRGFSAKEIATPVLLAKFFLSPIGIETVLQSLSIEEITFLYFVKEFGREVNIAPFSRIYGDASTGQKYYYGTFTQQYGDTLRRVRTSLVRKGVLLMAEDKHGGDTKMERWRFRFPTEFEAYLPALLPDAINMETPGTYREDVLRTKIMSIIDRDNSRKLPFDLSQYAWRIKGGTLFMGVKPYSVRRLEAWQNECWTKAAPKLRMPQSGDKKAKRYRPVPAAVYVLSQLAMNEWVAPQQLTPVFKVFCGEKIDAEKLFKAGWKWGLLAGLAIDGQFHYRLAAMPADDVDDMGSSLYLKQRSDQVVELDLAAVPYQTLAQLNQLAQLEIVEQNLVAKPSFIAAGSSSESIQKSPLAQWLRTNVAGYRQVFEKLDKRWGKQIIHEDLMLARVKDLSLKVKIEKSLKGAVVVLADDYIAFPTSQTSKVQRIVRQAGFAVREVSI